MQSGKPLRRFDPILYQILDVELWVVALAIAGSMVKPAWLPAAVMFGLAFWLLRWLVVGRVSIRTPLDWPILVLVFMLIVSVWATARPDTTLLQVWRVFSGIILFYAAANWVDTTNRLRTLLMGIAAAAVVLAGIAPFSVAWSIDKLPFIPPWIYDRFVVLFADYVHPNVLGGSLALLLPSMIAWLLFDFRHMGWLMRIGLGTAIFMAIGILVLTAARGAWMGLGCGLLLLGMLRWRWGWLGLLIAGPVVVFLAFRPGLQATVEFLASNTAIRGLDGRTEIWSRAIFMIRDFPFTGVGMGSFGDVADALYPFFLNTPGIPHTHNLFLQIGVDLGLPGLIAWLAMLMTVIAIGWQLFRGGKQRQEPLMLSVGAGLLASMLALVVHGMIDSVVWGMVKPAPLVWLLWGLAVAARLIF